jgi:ADP-heptose:LPS heptosyltransferase
VAGDSPDILETAQQLAEVDLLITVDTMLAHLAGALGRPVWLMLPYAADWRWMLDRADSPWYPTMRIFRQRSPGDWAPVVKAVESELAPDRIRVNTGPRCVLP